MSEDVVLRAFFALVLSLTLAWGVYRLDEQDRVPVPPEKGHIRYQTAIPTSMAAILISLPLLMLLFYDRAAIPRIMLSICFPIFFSICVYYALLLPLLPLLRRRISARTCALLWLLPNFLYYTVYSFMGLRAPRWVISLPVPMAAVEAVWAAGFCAVLGWKIVGHLRFRRALLKDARPVEDPDWLALWQRELKDAGYQKIDRALVISPAAATPLSIGLFLRTTRVVLPERDYAPEELALVLRHEIVHIGRRDSGTKFFLAFCTAVCWFNPLMWLAMERSAQDLELSCDETVLLEADDHVRRRYAELLLETAGDPRGFTTCLSASAQALRYRLRSVVHPVKRSGGALLAGTVLFTLLMTCGYTALAYDPATGAEALFSGGPAEDYELSSIQWIEPLRSYTCSCDDPGALTARLGALEMERLTGSYTFSETYPGLDIWVRGPQGLSILQLREKSLRLVPMGRTSFQWDQTYYLPQGADLDALRELLTFPEE